MTIQVLINGAYGKMGQECVKAFSNDAEFALVGKNGSDENLSAAIQKYKPQIVVDFTTPNSVFENALTIIAANAHPVIGTTGLKPEQIAELEKRCAEKKLGGVVAPNFSIGATLMVRFAQQAAKYFPDAEIIELHHPAKLDAPSGTAIKTAECIAAARLTNPSQTATAPARGAISHGIPIHAVRLPGLVANQEVLFGGQGETLRISHYTINRETFMPGVLLACKKVLQLDHLVYGLEHLL